MKEPKKVNVLKSHQNVYLKKWLKRQIIYGVYLTPINSHKKRGTEGEIRKEKGLGDSLEAFICKDLNFKAK